MYILYTFIKFYKYIYIYIIGWYYISINICCIIYIYNHIYIHIIIICIYYIHL